jgi:hypothetical protein
MATKSIKPKRGKIPTAQATINALVAGFKKKGSKLTTEEAIGILLELRGYTEHDEVPESDLGGILMDLGVI